MDEKKEQNQQPQTQDLNWQHPEESDNLQKSERPNTDYMKDRDLDPETHGKVNK